MTNQTSIPDPITTRAWAAATAVGFGLAFLSFIPGMLAMNPFLPEGLRYLGPSAMPEILDPEALPAWLDQQTYRSWYRIHLGYHAVALALFGSIVGWFQSRVLRGHLPATAWMAATAMGFLAILGVEIVELHAVIGPHAGPMEPLMISMGGSIMAGLGQWWVLRRRGVVASRWLVSWSVGVVLGVAVGIPVWIVSETAAQGIADRAFTGVVAETVSWSAGFLTFGLAMGAVAGAISARALSSSLAVAASNDEDEP